MYKMYATYHYSLLTTHNTRILMKNATWLHLSNLVSSDYGAEPSIEQGACSCPSSRGIVSLSNLDRLLNLARTAPCETLKGNLMDSLHGRPQDSVASISIAVAETESSIPFMLLAWGSEICTVSVPVANTSSYSGAAWPVAPTGELTTAGAGAGVSAGSGTGSGTETAPDAALGAGAATGVTSCVTAALACSTTRA